MKRIIILYVILLSLFLESKAGDCFKPNCNPVEDIIWIISSYNPLDLGNGCLVSGFSIHYKKCDDGTCTFTFIPPTVPSNCSYYYSNPRQFLFDIMAAILKSLDYPCKSQRVGGCAENIEFYLSNCWKWDGPIPIDPNDPPPNLITCDANGCCQIVWQVCKTSDGPPPVYTATPVIEQEVTSCQSNDLNCIFILCVH